MAKWSKSAAYQQFLRCVSEHENEHPKDRAARFTEAAGAASDHAQLVETERQHRLAAQMWKGIAERHPQFTDREVDILSTGLVYIVEHDVPVGDVPATAVEGMTLMAKLARLYVK